MDMVLPIYPEQALKKIQELNRQSIEYANRIIQQGSEDEVERAIATDNLENAILSFVVLLEQYPDKHGTLLEEARNLLKSSREAPLKVTVLDGEPFLVWPYRLLDFVGIFKAIHLPEKKTEKDVSSLLEVITNSEYYITETGIFKNVPSSENDVHVRIEGLLKCIYPDLLTEPRLSKHIKSFDPDTAIPSLKTLIEYKYITNRTEGKRILDQILADISGYQADDYDNFIFVIYETHRLFPKGDWTRVIESCKPRNPIEFVVMKGVASPKKTTKQILETKE